MVTVLAPGINVYSMDIDKSKNYYETLKDYSEPFLALGSIVGGNPEEGYHSVIDVHIRNCKIFSTERLNACHESDPLRIMIADAQKEMDNFVDLFRSEYQASAVSRNHDLIFMRYEQGEFFKYYEGGELEFKYFNIKYSPKIGDCIVFSAAFPYMHRVNEITKGTRYAAVNWYKYI